MKSVQRTTTATPADVWRVLSDGWTFASWVVGASRVRAVSPEWPAPGAHVHHSVGTWPAVTDDNTEVLESEPERLLVVQARVRPFGEARVEIGLAPEGDGCTITIREDVVRGPSRLVPAPVRQAGLWIRNKETLHRLALLAERRTQD